MADQDRRVLITTSSPHEVVDENVRPPRPKRPRVVLSDASDSTYSNEEESTASSVSTLYEEETVASGLSAPANLNGASASQGLQQLAFASSLQLAAANGQQQPVFHAQ